VLPRFNAERQVLEYTEHFYGPAARHALRLATDGATAGRALADWKQRIVAHWPQVRVRLVEGPPAALKAGEGFRLAVGVTLEALDATDVCVECQLGINGANGRFELRETRELAAADGRQGSEQVFAADVGTALSGLASLRVRVYPHHALLAHRFEMGRMRWL